MKLAVYEAANNGEITESQKDKLMQEIEIKDLCILESVIEENVESLSTDLDYLMLEYETSTILVESGDIYVYEAKAKQIEQKSKGILLRIISAVKALFTKLKNWLSGKKVGNSENAPKEIKVKISPQKAKAAIDKKLSIINKILAAGSVAPVAVAGISTARVMHTSKKAEEISKNFESLKDINAENRQKADEYKSKYDHASSKLAAASKVNTDLKKELEDLKKASSEARERWKNGLKSEASLREGSYQSALDEYSRITRYCEDMMGEINKKILEKDISMECVRMLQSEFLDLKAICQMCQSSAFEIVKKTNDEVVRNNASSLVNKKLGDHQNHPDQYSDRDSDVIENPMIEKFTNGKFRSSCEADILRKVDVIKNKNPKYYQTSDIEKTVIKFKKALQNSDDAARECSSCMQYIAKTKSELKSSGGKGDYKADDITRARTRLERFNEYFEDYYREMRKYYDMIISAYDKYGK